MSICTKPQHYMALASITVYQFPFPLSPHGHEQGTAGVSQVRCSGSQSSRGTEMGIRPDFFDSTNTF